SCLTKVGGSQSVRGGKTARGGSFARGGKTVRGGNASGSQGVIASGSSRSGIRTKRGVRTKRVLELEMVLVVLHKVMKNILKMVNEGLRDGLHKLKCLKQLMNMQGMPISAWPYDGTPDDLLGADEILMTNT
nr:hypothetical protein [Tanacetum cinerariifolium]